MHIHYTNLKIIMATIAKLVFAMFGGLFIWVGEILLLPKKKRKSYREIVWRKSKSWYEYDDSLSLFGCFSVIAVVGIWNLIEFGYFGVSVMAVVLGMSIGLYIYYSLRD